MGFAILSAIDFHIIGKAIFLTCVAENRSIEKLFQRFLASTNVKGFHGKFFKSLELSSRTKVRLENGWISKQMI